MPGISEIFPDALYDYQNFKAGTKEAVFLQVPIGVDGRTHFDTNMVLPGFLPMGHLFQVNELELVCFERNRRRYAELGESGLLVVTIISKIYVSRHARQCMRPWRRELTTSGRPVQLMTDEIPWMTGPLRFAPPLVLWPSQQFVAMVTWEKGLPYPARLGVSLNGIAGRPSQ